MAPCWTRACSRSRRTSSARSASPGAPRASSSARTAGATSSPCCPRARARPRRPSSRAACSAAEGRLRACRRGPVSVELCIRACSCLVLVWVCPCTQRSRAAGISAHHGRGSSSWVLARALPRMACLLFLLCCLLLCCLLAALLHCCFAACFSSACLPLAPGGRHAAPPHSASTPVMQVTIVPTVVQCVSPLASALAMTLAPAEGAAPAPCRRGAAAGGGRHAARGGALPAHAPRARAAGGRAHRRETHAAGAPAPSSPARTRTRGTHVTRLGDMSPAAPLSRIQRGAEQAAGSPRAGSLPRVRNMPAACPLSTVTPHPRGRTPRATCMQVLAPRAARAWAPGARGRTFLGSPMPFNLSPKPRARRCLWRRWTCAASAWRARPARWSSSWSTRPAPWRSTACRPPRRAPRSCRRMPRPNRTVLLLFQRSWSSTPFGAGVCRCCAGDKLSGRRAMYRWPTRAAGAALAGERCRRWVFADVARSLLRRPRHAHRRGRSCAAQGAALQLLQQSYTSRDQVTALCECEFRGVFSFALLTFRKWKAKRDLSALGVHEGCPASRPPAVTGPAMQRLTQRAVESRLRRLPNLRQAALTRRARARGPGVGDPVLWRPRGGAAAAEQVDCDGAAAPGRAALRRRLPARARHLDGAPRPAPTLTPTVIPSPASSCPAESGAPP